MHNLRATLLVPDSWFRGEGHRTGDAAKACRVRCGRHEWNCTACLLGAHTAGDRRRASLGLLLAVDSIARDWLSTAEKSECGESENVCNVHFGEKFGSKVNVSDEF